MKVSPFTSYNFRLRSFNKEIILIFLKPLVITKEIKEFIIYNLNLSNFLHKSELNHHFPYKVTELNPYKDYFFFYYTRINWMKDKLLPFPHVCLESFSHAKLQNFPKV